MPKRFEKILRIFDKSFKTLQNLEKKILGTVMSSDAYPIIHSLKSRVKTRESLAHKLKRKGEDVSESNFFEKITDLVGLRILILYPQNFKEVHEFVMDEIKKKDWILHEPPKAYTWDQDMKEFFSKDLEIEKVEKKQSMYSSLHYVVKAKEGDPCCEIQVRTLLEEAWGEIDHDLNYPVKHGSRKLQNHLKILALIVDAGIKLARVIYGFKK